MRTEVKRSQAVHVLPFLACTFFGWWNARERDKTERRSGSFLTWEEYSCVQLFWMLHGQVGLYGRDHLSWLAQRVWHMNWVSIEGVLCGWVSLEELFFHVSGSCGHGPRIAEKPLWEGKRKNGEVRNEWENAERREWLQKTGAPANKPYTKTNDKVVGVTIWILWSFKRPSGMWSNIPTWEVLSKILRPRCIMR